MSTLFDRLKAIMATVSETVSNFESGPPPPTNTLEAAFYQQVAQLGASSVPAPAPPPPVAVEVPIPATPTSIPSYPPTGTPSSAVDTATPISQKERRVLRTVLTQNFTEAVAGTRVDTAVEVPGSTGALAVKLVDVDWSMDAPAEVLGDVSMVVFTISATDITAALSAVPANAILCYTTSAEAILLYRRAIRSVNADTDTVVMQTLDGSKKLDEIIPRGPDGKFYVTVSVLGVNNAIVRSVSLRCTFDVLVERNV